ncbi:hypothetical protein D3C75_626320 [compost metagenome]
MLRGPFADGSGVFAEHSFARTGRIQHNPVKNLRKTAGQLTRRCAGYNGVGDAETFDILRQNLSPFRVNLIGNEQSLSLHQSCDMGCFAAGSCRKIKHGLTGAGGQQFGCGHCGGLLNII